MRCLTQQVIYGIKSSAYANIDISSPHKFYVKLLIYFSVQGLDYYKIKKFEASSRF